MIVINDPNPGNLNVTSSLGLINGHKGSRTGLEGLFPTRQTHGNKGDVTKICHHVKGLLGEPQQ